MPRRTFPDQIIFYGRACRAAQSVGGAFLDHERVTLFHSVVSGLILLLPLNDSVLKRRYLQFFIECLDALLDQLVGLEIHRVDGLAVNASPKFLELLLFKIRIEWVHLAFAVVFDLGELGGAKDAVYEL
jgi:hypothetical protein